MRARHAAPGGHAARRRQGRQGASRWPTRRKTNWSSRRRRSSGIERLVMERDRRRNRRFFVADGFTELEGPSRFTLRPAATRSRSRAALHDAKRRWGSPWRRRSCSWRRAIARSRCSRICVHRRRAPPMVTQGIDVRARRDADRSQGLAGGRQRSRRPCSPTTGSGQPALSLTATMSAAAPAVVAFDPALHGPGPAVGTSGRCAV